jgi:hypothetical protein
VVCIEVICQVIPRKHPSILSRVRGSGLDEVVYWITHLNYNYNHSEIRSSSWCDLTSPSSSGSWLSWFLLWSQLCSVLVWSGLVWSPLWSSLICLLFLSSLISYLLQSGGLEDIFFMGIRCSGICSSPGFHSRGNVCQCTHCRVYVFTIAA